MKHEIKDLEMVKVESLEKQMAEMRSQMNNSLAIELRTLPEAEIRKCIMSYISDLKDGDEIYSSDIAFEFGIDLECVMDKMMMEGTFR